MRQYLGSRVTLAGLLASVLMIACSGEKTTQPPPVTPPAALRLTIPDTVTRGQAFSLTVTALDGQGQTNAGWSGTVLLSASAGSISPATLSVTNGTATVQATIAQHAGSINLTSAVGSTIGSRSAFVLSEQPVARLEIHPQTFLLAGSGVSQALSVRVLDADGLPTRSSGVTWQSSKAGVVAVSSNGVATATGSGSSTITARAGTISSDPALAYVTTPAAGVLLVTDDQVTSGITPVNPQARYGPGWQYRVRLTGTPPQVGQVLASRGEKPIAGRVVGVQSAGAAGSDVTLQLVPLDQVFPNLSIDETIPLRLATASRFFPREGAPWALVEEEFNWGPFECEASLTQPNSNPFSPASVTRDITPTLQAHIVNTATHQRLVVQGGLTASLRVNPTLTAAINGSIECKVQVGDIPIPVGGALAPFFGARVPLGLGFSVEGGVTLATMGLDLAVSGGTTLSFGYDSHAPSGLVFNITGSSTGSVKPDLPSLSSDFRVAAGVSLFAFADFQIGPPDFFPGAADLQLPLLESKAGVKQDFNLSTADVQSADAAYASTFSLAPFFSGGTTKDVQQVIDILLTLVGVSISPLKYESTGTAFAQSPVGSFQIVPSRVRASRASTPGDTATFIVDLSRTSYLTQYAVESIKLFQKPSPGASLVPAPGACASISAGANQSLFTCKTSFPESMAGEQTFYAFVKPTILGAALPVLLEVAEDAKGTINVDTATVVYETKFNSGPVDSVWSHRTAEVAPSSERYLGKFANEPVKLVLSNLPTHGKVIVEMDLYIIDSWDGSNANPGNGPDIVTITVGGTRVLHSTFSNVNGRDDHRQSYPDTYPGPLHDAATGALVKNVLGYPGSSNHNEDSIYRFRFEVDHTAGSIVVEIKGTNITPAPDEWWGLDNIRVVVR